MFEHEKCMSQDGLCMPEAVTVINDKGYAKLIILNDSVVSQHLAEGQIVRSLHQVDICNMPVCTEETKDGVLGTLHGRESHEWNKHLQSELNLDLKLTQSEKMCLQELIHNISDVFTIDSSELGSTELVQNVIDTGNLPPI